MPGATTKRRVRWTLGILALPLVYAASVALVVIFDGAYSGERLWPVVVYIAVVIAAFVFAIGFLGRTVREILLTVRMRRQERTFDDAVGAAGALAERLAAGEAAPGVEAGGWARERRSTSAAQPNWNGPPPTGTPSHAARGSGGRRRSRFPTRGSSSTSAQGGKQSPTRG